ncbi:MAG TPA: L,D-transpeptidase [Pyrinomonadaceae bacterium]|nr:L,D-transpeptidase [Pyrinomonadaceae bacterium]
MSRATHTLKTLAAPALALLSLCAALAASRHTAAPVAATQLTAEEEAANSRPLKLPLRSPRLLVRKKERRLVLYDGEAAVRVYRMVLGSAPEGDKVRQGDGRTPEGDFYVCVKNDKSRFHLSLGLSYPNEAAAERGLRDEIINRKQYERIVRAVRNKQRPPWDTALGGEIMIHGGGTGGDWTLGCVALENQHIEELFKVLPMGTPVRIEP